jgi:hypothetical protein
MVLVHKMMLIKEIRFTARLWIVSSREQIPLNVEGFEIDSNGLERYSTPASVLAADIVQAAMSSAPPAYLTSGATSRIPHVNVTDVCTGWKFSLLYYLPTWLSDMWVASLYGSDKVVPRTITE